VVRVPDAISITNRSNDAAAVERLLRQLPEWFGIEQSLREYVDDAAHLPTYLATADSGDVVGVLLLKPHFPTSAEVHLMAVNPGWHRRGVGRSLLAAAETDLAADGVTLLQVKTLGPSRPDAHYELTRLFYLAQGFLPVEEFLDLWEDNPCLLMVKVLVRSPIGSRCD
jgi:GNAT superfamily N-acetyltransferase